jgi:hypothetical protein
MLARLFVCALSLLAFHGALAQQPAEDANPAPVESSTPPRNFDFIGAAVRAGIRAQKTTPPVVSTSTSTPTSAPAAASPSAAPAGLSARNLRMLAARGMTPSYNICSVTLPTGGGAAQAPVLNNLRLDNTCIVNGLVVGGH